MASLRYEIRRQRKHLEVAHEVVCALLRVRDAINEAERTGESDTLPKLDQPIRLMHAASIRALLDAEIGALEEDVQARRFALQHDECILAQLDAREEA